MGDRAGVGRGRGVQLAQRDHGPVAFEQPRRRRQSQHQRFGVTGGQPLQVGVGQRRRRREPHLPQRVVEPRAVAQPGPRRELVAQAQPARERIAEARQVASRGRAVAPVRGGQRVERGAAEHRQHGRVLRSQHFGRVRGGVGAVGGDAARPAGHGLARCRRGAREQHVQQLLLAPCLALPRLVVQAAHATAPSLATPIAARSPSRACACAASPSSTSSSGRSVSHSISVGTPPKRRSACA
ncbi:hypothetical protein GALL_382300 [mine drainage metagenome]|uniref:Uncharacterized protein n=1 Tax=mine drainage metagenome TaxID=410659 RepID=A0A1J5Q8P3_9ZZZZ